MNPEQEPRVKNDPLDIEALLARFSKRWHWFLLSIPIFLVMAYFQNKNAVGTHYIESQMLIHVNEDRMIYSEDAVTGLNTMFRKKTVENELTLLKSRDLIARALDSLEFNVNYFIGDLDHEVLWGDLPIRVHADFGKAHKVANVPFKLQFHEDQSYTLYAEDKELGKGHFGQEWSYKNFLFDIDRREGAYFDELPEKEVIFYVNDNDAMIRYFEGRLNVMESDRDTDAITLSINESVQERGIRFLEELLEVYVMKLVEDRKRIAQHTYDFIEERLRINFGDLDSLEWAIDSYKAQREIVMPDIEAKYILEGIKKFEIELNDAETQKDIVDQLVENVLSDPRQEMDLSVPVTMLGVTDPLLNDLMIDLNKKQYKLKMMGKTIHRDNPLYQEMEAQVSDLRSSLMVDLLNMQENMHTTVAYIRRQIRDYKRQLEEMNLEEKDLVTMERLRDSKEELYTYLLKKREEAAIILASEILDTWVIEKPHAVSFFYEPKRSVVFLIAFFLGLFVPTSIILLEMLLDTRIRSSREVRKKLPIPLAAEIPFQRPKNNELEQSLPLVGPLVEDLKRLAFNLRFIREDHQVIMLSSHSSGDGKTFTVDGLGYTLARIGKKVCVVDLDLRRYGLSIKQGLNDMPGSAEVLLGDTEISKVIRPSEDQANLHYISSGVRPLDPTPLLSSNRLDAMIEELKASFDIILIDTPPLGAVSDALMTQRVSDLNLLVIRQDITRKQALRSFETLLNDRTIHHPAFVFNGVPENSREKAYTYGREELTFRERVVEEIKYRLANSRFFGRTRA